VRKLGFESITQRSDAPKRLNVGVLEGCLEPYGKRCVLASGAKSALLRTSQHKGRWAPAMSPRQRANPSRPTQLVSTDRKAIGSGAEAHANLTQSLHRIHV
jgi:hypothetical protein